MKAWSVIGLLFTAAILATIPISPQVTARGVELGLDQAQAITYGRYRRVTRRAYRRSGYGLGAATYGYGYGGSGYGYWGTSPSYGYYGNYGYPAYSGYRYYRPFVGRRFW